MRLLPTNMGVLPLALSSLLLFTEKVVSHTWGEAQYRIALNGTFIGDPGFTRALPVRDATFFDGMVSWLIPPNENHIKQILPTDKLIAEGRRKLTDNSYTEQHPMLKVAPGDWVAFTYAENGHVTKQDTAISNAKPINRGNVYVYVTYENDLTDYNLMDVHLNWTADGKGGNGEGRLLATRNFDDGQCYEALGVEDVEGILTYRMKQASGEKSIVCQTDFQIPADAKPGKIMTVIWVWDWPTMNKRGIAVSPASYNDPSIVFPEIYVSVADYQIVEPCDPQLGEVKGPTCGSSAKAKNVNFVKQPSPTRAAIKAHMESSFLVHVPQAGFDVKEATAEKINIPMANLIGLDKSIDSRIPDKDMVYVPVKKPGSGSESDEPPSPSVSTIGPGIPSLLPPPPKQEHTRTTAAPPAASSSDDEGVLTVIVTVPETTVFVTSTRTATADTPTITPEPPKSKRSNVRRGQGQWTFGVER